MDWRPHLKSMMGELGFRFVLEDDELLQFKLGESRTSAPADASDDWEDGFEIPSIVIFRDASLVSGNLAAHVGGWPDRVRQEIVERKIGTSAVAKNCSTDLGRLTDMRRLMEGR